MRLLVAREPLRRFLRWTRRTLFVVGVSVLAYCTYALVDSRVFQRVQGSQFERLLTVRKEVDGEAPISPRLWPPTVAGGLIGRIEIPRLGLSAVVIEGTSTTTLRRAVGHIASTALPGQLGNIGLSGHRDTFFRPLRNIRESDVITFTTLVGGYRYRVVSTQIVRPDNVDVLAPGGDEILTLVTCYPFYFVGAAPYRFIVRAKRVT
jgi:sortase A